MNQISGIWLIYRKEILNFIKNKEALLVMLLVPFLIYPGVTFLTSDLLKKQLLSSTQEEFSIQIAYISEAQNAIPKEILHLNQFLKKEAINNKNETVKIKYNVSEISTHHSAPLLSEKNTILITCVTNAPNASKYQLGEAQIYFDSRNDLAYTAIQFIKDSIRLYNEELTLKALETENISADILRPIKLAEFNNVAPKDFSIMKYGSSLLAIILIFLTYVSCQYAATEVIPAEREQLTLETLLSTPIKWNQIVLGKYLAIVTAGFLNAIANLAGIILFGSAIIAGMAQQGGNQFSLNFTPFYALIILLTLIPLSFMCGALSLLLVSFARSRVTASYFSLPGMMLVAVPSILSLLPNTELKGIWYIVPFANITLFIRNVMTENITVLMTIGIFVNIVTFSILLASLSILASNRKDNIINGGLSFSLFYRSKDKVAFLSITEAFTIFIVSFVLFIQGNILIGMTISPYRQLVLFWGFFLLPCIVYLLYKNIRVLSFLCLNTFKIKDLLFTITLFPAILFLTSSGSALIDWIMPDLKDSSNEVTQIVVTMIKEHNFYLVLFVFSVTPAIVEEIIYRGIIFGSLIKKLSPFKTIMITSFLFVLSHSISRMFPLLPVAIFLGILRYKTKSLWTTILLHAIFNAYSLNLARLMVNSSEEALRQKLADHSTLIAFTIIASFSMTTYYFFYSTTTKEDKTLVAE